jgi:hypothetical protein
MTLATITQADIPVVCERLRALIRSSDADEVVCVVSTLEADLVAVEALARLRLTAGRLGCRLRLRGSSRALEQLLVFCGLCDVLPLEGELGGIRWHGRQAEQREPPRGVEKRVEARDPPV